MSRCAQCGFPTLAPDALCQHHAGGHADDWAAGNRMICDFLHRGVVSSAPREKGNQ